MAERKERLVLSILEFLEASIADGTVSTDDRDGVEVASERNQIPVMVVTEQLNQCNVLEKHSA
jgi:hypothetical protein